MICNASLNIVEHMKALFFAKFGSRNLTLSAAHFVQNSTSFSLMVCVFGHDDCPSSPFVTSAKNNPPPESNSNIRRKPLKKFRL